VPAFEVATYPSSVVVLRLRPGEELLESVSQAASKLGIRSGLVIAIGGLRRAEVGVFKGREYDVAVYEAKEGETIELTSALGSIAVDENGKPSVHIHVTISLPDHRPASGHLLRGVVGPLAEVFIVSLDVALRRVLDPSIGLPALSA